MAFQSLRPRADPRSRSWQSTSTPSGSTQDDPSLLSARGTLPSISLPKGGGAIGGMSEKFDVSAAVRTATLSIPIAVSPSRGLQPDLSLTYDSGNSNGVFGLGWSLSQLSITRKTFKSISQYHNKEESDVFLLSEAEDLIPIFKKGEDGENFVYLNGVSVVQEEFRDGYVIRKYSPRVDQSFL